MLNFSLSSSFVISPQSDASVSYSPGGVVYNPNSMTYTPPAMYNSSSASYAFPCANTYPAQSGCSSQPSFTPQQSILVQQPVQPPVPAQYQHSYPPTNEIQQPSAQDNIGETILECAAVFESKIVSVIEDRLEHMKHTIEDTISDLAVRHIKDKLSTWLDSLTLPTPQSSMSSGQENISTSPCNATNEHVHPSVTIEIASTLPNADTDVRKKALVIGINYYAMQKAFGLSNPNSPKGSSASLHASPQSPQGLAQGSLQGLVQGSLQGLAQGSLHGSRLFVSDDVNINNAHEMYLLCREVGYNNVCVLFDSPGDPEQVIEEIVEAASSDDDFETVSEDEYKNISENFVTPPAFPNNRLDNIAPMPPKYDGWCGIVPPPESPIGSYVPTRENILRALGWLLTDSTHVVLYFSGKTDLLCSSPTGAIMSSDGHERGPICFDDILNVIRTSNVISARIIVDSKCAFGLIPQKHMLTEVSTSEDIGRNVFKLVTSPSVEAYDKDIISIYPDTSGSLSYQCAMTHILAKLILSKHKSADIYTICVALREELNSAGYMVSPCISSDRELTSSDIVIA